MTNNRITLDFETLSMCDLKKSGAYKYSLHPTTRPTCLVFKQRDGQVFLLSFEQINKPWESQPKGLRLSWLTFVKSNYLFTAHNAFFERCIYNNILVNRYGWPVIPNRLWRCTAAKAAACALPRSLDGVGTALNLTTQKDKSGYIAMMQTCKPTREWNNWKKRFDAGKAAKKDEPSKFLDPDKAPDVFQTLYHYCKMDVLTEELLDKTLPDLIPTEQEIWHLNQQINWRGVRVDIHTIKKITTIQGAEGKQKLKELDTLTMGLVTKPGARKSILEFLALEGIELPDIRANTVDDILKSGKLSPDMKRLLEIRKALSKTSTKKYQAFLDRSGSDWRVRDILLYHGASTGRDSGTGIQVQNFPRPIIPISKERPYAAIDNIKECTPDTLKLLYGDNLSLLFSSVLRNMIIPSDGCELFVADYSKIEVAVLWWLADNVPGLKVLKDGKDPYKYQAAANTGKRYNEIEDEGQERQLGKAQTLGCGFGMGAAKFQTTAWEMYRLKLSEAQSKQAVQSYRTTNAAVPELWRDVELAAIAAVESSRIPGRGGKSKIFKAGKCKFFCENDFLRIELPSGRRLSYLNPGIGWRETDYGTRRTIEFSGLAPDKKTMRRESTWGGTLTENIVQAVARDIMMQAMVKLERVSYRVLLTVHDEIICERLISEGDLKEFIRIMCELPLWADDKLPLEAKGWKGPRYRK